MTQSFCMTKQLNKIYQLRGITFQNLHFKYSESHIKLVAYLYFLSTRSIAANLRNNAELFNAEKLCKTNSCFSHLLCRAFK